MLAAATATRRRKKRMSEKARLQQQQQQLQSASENNLNSVVGLDGIRKVGSPFASGAWHLSGLMLQNMLSKQTQVMNYVSKFLSNVKEFYNEINSATLTGAIDVIIVQQEDGTYSCSPFHVRFGKIGVLRSREKVVDIEINGSPVNIHMKLGETGEAFFVEETEESTEVPSHLATSPIPSYDIGEEIAKLNKKVNSQNLQDTGQELERNGCVHTSVSMSAANPQAPSSLYLTSSMSKASYSIDPSESDTVYTAMSIMSVQDKHGTNEATLNTRNSHSVEQSSNSELIGTSRLSSSDSALPTEKVYQNDAVKNSLQLNISKYMVTSQDEVDNVMFHSAADSDLCAALNSSQVNQNVITDDDKLKMRKKRRKRSIIRKRKGREVSQNSSDEESPEEIFQMDVDDMEETSQPVAVSTTSLLNRKVIPTTTSDKLSDGSTSYSLPDRFKSTVNCTEEISDPSQHVNMDSHHNWQHKNNMPLNLDFHPFSDGDVTPILSPVTSRPPTPKSDTEYEIQKQESASQRETGENRWSWTWGELPVPPKGPMEMPKEEPMSDDETIKSKNLQKEEEQRSMLGGMFRFMRKTKKLRHQPESEGIYLDEINFDELDPEIAKLYFPPRNSGFHSHATPAIQTPGQIKDEDVESGNGSSLPQSPHSVEGAIGSLHGIDSDCEDRNSVFDFKGYNDLAMSLCGGLAEFDSEIPQERFLHSLITYDDFNENPNLLSNPDLVVRFNNKYYNWNTVAPMVMSLLSFQRPLPEKTVTNLVKDNTPKKPKKSETKSYSWFYWRRSTTPQEEDAKKTKEVKKDETDASKEDPAGIGPSTDDGKLTEVKVDPVEPKMELKEAMQLTTEEMDYKTDESNPQTDVPVSTCHSLPTAATTPTVEAESPELPAAKQFEEISPTQSEISSPPSSPMQKTLSTSVNDDDSINEMSPQLPPSEGSFTEEIKPGTKERYKKTLRLSSEQIAELNLKEGPNEVMFSVTTAYQGTTRCKCHIYLWKYDDKIVISDIDGTITKSDVLGHILPIIGKDWAQSGVAQLFTKIKNNGYQFLYLSARAIGQAHITREYLKSIRQGDVCLPDGPLLLNPSSLITAFHREVIEKKPEEFKISCLRDIQALFPSSRNPFYAGYGNKINDVWAYRAVGIPISRIFTINHKGELKHELTQTFQSSYSGLSYVVDHVFPPLRRSNERDGYLLSDFEGSDEFSSFTYWRPPIPEIQIEIPIHKGTVTDEKKKEEKK